jgi:GNAT superfamily N-acetyltransferase
VPRTWGALTGTLRRPSPNVRRTALAALCDGSVVGAAELELSVQDNTHLAEVSLHVLPGHRRRGVGSSLLAELDRRRRADGRTTVLGELVLDLQDRERAGLAFARAHGFASVHTEQHLVLPLPADPAATAALRRPVPGYELVTWRERCPEELRVAYCRMRTQMERDVPMGEVAYDPPVFDEERLRSQEERMAPLYHQVVAAARRTSDGEVAGYSVLFLPRDDHEVLQDDTLVMPAHRGRGLGLRLKRATLDVVAREHPDRVALHTWTDPANDAMWRTNAAFGYTPVEVLHEMQRRDPS